MRFGGVLIMATAQNFRILHPIADGDTVRKIDGDVGDKPTHTKIYVAYSKGRGYYINLWNVTVTRSHGMASESSMMDMSGQNTRYILKAPRFNARTLETIRTRLTSPGIFAHSIAKAWNEGGMDAAWPLIEPLGANL